MRVNTRGEKMACTLEEKKEEKPLQYVCHCCKGVMNSRESLPHGDPPICSECWRARMNILSALYNEIERPLSLLMQPETQVTKQTIDTIRTSLRTIMRNAGFEGPF